MGQTTMTKPRAQRKGGKRATVAVYKHGGGATAFQVDVHDGSAQLVACENLRVLVTKEDGSWIAQGLEIDYAVDGDTIGDVKKRFEHGLALTIESHLRVHTDIVNLLRPAPRKLWREYFSKRNALRRYTHSQIMVRQLQQHLPFGRILWAEEKDAVA